MPPIIRKSYSEIYESRREVLQTINWRVRSSVWTPPTDVYETPENFIVRVELAGMRDEDFVVALNDGMLTISGARPDTNERRAYRQMEIWFGKFDLAVEVPVPVDIDASSAEYKDGFLMVMLRKAAPQQLRAES